MAFSWKHRIVEAEKKLYYRTKQKSKSNPDFRLQHPELAKEVQTGSTDVELKKYVRKTMEKKLKYARVPKPSVIIKRMNRVVG